MQLGFCLEFTEPGLPLPGENLKNGTTTGLCSDSERLTSIFNSFESTDGTTSHWKYAVRHAIVYHRVYYGRLLQNQKETSIRG